MFNADLYCSLPSYWRQLKKYHLAHHYKNFDLGYGVTSKFWDIVFGKKSYILPGSNNQELNLILDQS